MADSEYIDAIKTYCIEEEKKQVRDIEFEYEKRLERYIEGSLHNPSCTNSGKMETDNYWINPNKIILSNDFGFYHHSPEEILKFSLQKRGDYKYLISQMNDKSAASQLYLDEYPAPFTQDYLYMIGQNGNHRAGVFRTIGLPYVTAKISRITSNYWTYYTYSPFHKNILYLFQELNLIKIIDYDSGKYTFIPLEGFAIWILPSNFIESIFETTRNIRNRIQLVENLYPEYCGQIPRLLKSNLLFIDVWKTAWKYRNKDC